ncbi:MAG: DUF3237 domain-containing protein [Acidobacteriota bacterium]|nr:DUF3237 domain-containing protein [Acidobacteriota bacterium]
MIELAHVADVTVMVGEPLEIGPTGAGFRRVIPILGGEVRGPRLAGVVLPGGADWQTVRADGVFELRARYAMETHDGHKILIDNFGIRRGPAEAMARLRRGEEADPASIYFRATPRFEAAHEDYRWLTRSIFLCDGARRRERVELALYEVL